MGCQGERRGGHPTDGPRMRLWGCVPRHEGMAECSRQRSSPGRARSGGGRSAGPAGRADGWGRSRPRGDGGLGAGGWCRAARHWAVGRGGGVPTRSRMNLRGGGSRPLLALC